MSTSATFLEYAVIALVGVALAALVGHAVGIDIHTLFQQAIAQINATFSQATTS